MALPRRISPAWAAAAGAFALAALLRFWDFDSVAPTPFYDAAVRSMGQSWRGFFFGIYEPSGLIAIDKPPIDLWVQVVATKVFGFNSSSLRLPQALAGVAEVGLLYDLVRRGFGHKAALASALALAVLPIAVLTSRSDTMDTLMGALLLAGMWVIAVARPRQQVGAVIAAGALAGLAFEVKLFQAGVGLPALVVLAWLAVEGTVKRRLTALALGSLAFLVVAAAWPIAATLAPGAHPFPIGSTDGTVANVILRYNGLDRIGPIGPGAHGPSHPGPFRLVSHALGLRTLIGIELVPALVLGGIAALMELRWRAPDLARRAIGAGLATWFLTGLAFFSIQGRLRPRYLEAFSPAVAAALGIGLALLIGATLPRRGRDRMVAAVLAAALALLLAWPLATSARLANTAKEDSQSWLGAMPRHQLDALHRFLHAHAAQARYELATSTAALAGPVIARDGLPVLPITTWFGRPIISRRALQADVRAGRVRYLLLDETGCRAKRAPSCAPAIRWALAHSTRVTARAGLKRPRVLLQLG